MRDLHREDVGARLDVVVERMDAGSLPRQLHDRQAAICIRGLQLVRDAGELGDRIVSRIPRLQRHADMRGRGKVLQDENHAGDGGRYHATAGECLCHLFPVEIARGDGVARPAIGFEHRVMTAEVSEIRRRAASRIGFQVNNGLLLRLGPETLAVEETGESDLNLQGSPGQGQDEPHHGDQRVRQWHQAL